MADLEKHTIGFLGDDDSPDGGGIGEFYLAADVDKRLADLAAENARLRQERDEWKAGMEDALRDREAVEAEMDERLTKAWAERDELRRDVEFWRGQQKLAANVAAGIADLDEQAPALRQMLRQERTRRKALEDDNDRLQARLDTATAHVEELRGQRDEARNDLAAAMLHHRETYGLLLEARLAEGAMRPVVEAAEALVDGWRAHRSVTGYSLMAFVDAWRAAQVDQKAPETALSASVGDERGEVIPEWERELLDRQAAAEALHAAQSHPAPRAGRADRR